MLGLSYLFSSSEVERDQNRKDASWYDDIPREYFFHQDRFPYLAVLGDYRGVGVDDDDELSVVELELAGVDEEELVEAGTEEDEDATLELAGFDEDELAGNGGRR